MAVFYNTQILGAGPAGMSFFIALENALLKADDSQRQKLTDLYDNVVVIEARGKCGGKLGKYRINANTDAQDVVSSIADHTAFSAIRDDFLKHIQFDQPLISLADVDRLLQQPMAKKMRAMLGDRLLLNSAVTHVSKDDKGFHSFARHGEHLASSHNMVIACGASEPVINELLPFKDKTIVASALLSLNTLNIAAHDGDIVIVGASHSGFSCAWRLLNDPLFAGIIKDRQIKIIYRSAVIKLRGTREFAELNEMPFKDPEDVCQDTGIVYRHAGLRKDAKQLYLDIKNNHESRVQLIKIQSLGSETKLLKQAGLVVQCCGFAGCFPKLTVNGKAIEIGMQSKYGELRDADTGEIIKGLFGNGLGVDTQPEHGFRGEASFTGSTHGLQIYQLSSSPRIIAKILQAQT